MFRKKTGPYKKIKDLHLLEEDHKENVDSAFKVNQEPLDLMDYNIQQHELEMKRRKAEIIRRKEFYEHSRMAKEKVFHERREGNDNYLGGSVDHSDCDSRQRTIVFQNMRTVQYPAIITYEYGEFTGYAYRFENCTGRGYTLEECMAEIALDLRYPLQDYFNEYGCVPQYSRNTILESERAYEAVKNGAKIKLVNVEIDISSMRND